MRLAVSEFLPFFNASKGNGKSFTQQAMWLYECCLQQQIVIPAKGEAGVPQSMLCACVTAGLCRSQRALQAKPRSVWLVRASFVGRPR